MRVIVLYRPVSEHATTVERYIRDVQHQTGHEMETVSIDSVEGSELAKLYDIVRYPALLALTDDGVMVRLWQDELLPTINEVSAYLRED